MAEVDVGEFAELLALLRGGEDRDPVVSEGDVYRVVEQNGFRVLEVDGWDGPCRDGSSGEEYAHDLRIQLLPDGAYRLWSREPARTGPAAGVVARIGTTSRPLVRETPRQPWGRGVVLRDFEDLHTWVYEL